MLDKELDFFICLDKSLFKSYGFSLDYPYPKYGTLFNSKLHDRLKNIFESPHFATDIVTTSNRIKYLRIIVKILKEHRMTELVFFNSLTSVDVWFEFTGDSSAKEFFCSNRYYPCVLSS